MVAFFQSTAGLRGGSRSRSCCVRSWVSFNSRVPDSKRRSDHETAACSFRTCPAMPRIIEPRIAPVTGVRAAWAAWAGSDGRWSATRRAIWVSCSSAGCITHPPSAQDPWRTAG